MTRGLTCALFLKDCNEIHSEVQTYEHSKELYSNYDDNCFWAIATFWGSLHSKRLYNSINSTLAFKLCVHFAVQLILQITLNTDFNS